MRLKKLQHMCLVHDLDNHLGPIYSTFQIVWQMTHITELQLTCSHEFQAERCSDVSWQLPLRKLHVEGLLSRQAVASLRHCVQLTELQMVVDAQKKGGLRRLAAQLARLTNLQVLTLKAYERMEATPLSAGACDALVDALLGLPDLQ